MKLKAKAYLRIAAKKPIKDWRKKYDKVRLFSEGLASVRLGDEETGKWGFVDVTGNEVISPKYDWVVCFIKGFAEVQRNRKYGFINKTGEEVVPLKYDSVGFFLDGFVKVELEDQWGFVDVTGKEVIPCIYDYEDLPKRKNILTLSLRIREKYERDPEGLEFVCPEFDWKAWYEQVKK